MRQLLQKNHPRELHSPIEPVRLTRLSRNIYDFGQRKPVLVMIGINVYTLVLGISFIYALSVTSANQIFNLLEYIVTERHRASEPGGYCIEHMKRPFITFHFEIHFQSPVTNIK